MAEQIYSIMIEKAIGFVIEFTVIDLHTDFIDRFTYTLTIHGIGQQTILEDLHTAHNIDNSRR